MYRPNEVGSAPTTRVNPSHAASQTWLGPLGEMRRLGVMLRARQHDKLVVTMAGDQVPATDHSFRLGRNEEKSQSPGMRPNVSFTSLKRWASIMSSATGVDARGG